jgi:hypothetical protein
MSVVKRYLVCQAIANPTRNQAFGRFCEGAQERQVRLWRLDIRERIGRPVIAVEGSRQDPVGFDGQQRIDTSNEFGISPSCLIVAAKMGPDTFIGYRDERLFGHSMHFTYGLPQTTLIHSLAKAGARTYKAAPNGRCGDLVALP